MVPCPMQREKLQKSCIPLKAAYQQTRRGVMGKKKDSFSMNAGNASLNKTKELP